MRITFEDRDWQLDANSCTVAQATVLYMTYKMTLRDYLEGLDRLDYRAFHFLYWLMLQQNGVVKPLADTDPDLMKFATAFATAESEEPPEAEPDPTSPLPTPAAPASSEPSTPTTTTPALPGQ